MVMRKRRVSDSRLAFLLLIGLVVAGASIWVVRQLPGVHRLELLAYDWHSAALPRLAADGRIALVGIDRE